MTRNTTLWIIGTIAVVTALAIPKLLSAPKPGSEPKNSARKAKIPVSVIVIQPELFAETITSPGTLFANEQIVVKSETSGRILAIFFKEGGEVAQGQRLLKLYDADLQAQLLKVTASLRLASTKEARVAGLFAKELVSREEYDSAVKDLQSSRADSALISSQIEKTDIRAPFGGRIGLKYISPGEYLTPGSPIVDLVSVRPLKLEFSISESYFGRVNPGDTIRFSVGGVTKTYSAEVFAKAPSIDEGTRTVRIRARCTNPDSLLAPGVFVTVTFALAERPQALFVPTQALVPDIAGWKLFVVREGVARPTPVTLGVRDSARIEIKSGLKAGDTIVTAGVALLRPGSQVAIRKAD
jgi:membrane fusion protein (multidrug efflux system)